MPRMVTATTKDTNAFLFFMSYNIIVRILCYCDYKVTIVFIIESSKNREIQGNIMSFAVETPSVTFAIENSPITNHSSLICAKGALRICQSH
jgi:hypothetical protein